MLRKLIYITVVLGVFNIPLSAQKSGDVIIKVSPDFDIRKTAGEYLDSPDLWPYILKYNEIKNLSDLQTGSSILIPQKEVRNMISRLKEADKSIQEAVLIGAKILADDLLNSAITSYHRALAEKDNMNFSFSEKSSVESIELAKKAYQQTKEIREKTIEAIISYKKGTAQKKFPSMLKWEDADIYENLNENDWARTLALSLAKITFHDLSQIKLNQNSQAVIQSSRFDQLDNKSTTKVKLEKGDAYAMLMNSPKKKFDLDIKGVKTKINSKYFWVEKSSGDSKFANYNGDITLAVKDSAVVVEKNQGSVVPDDGYPSEPKNLLPAPEILSPADFTTIGESNPVLNWTKINQAGSYWVEIASDPDFKMITDRYKEVKESVQASSLKSGVYYWHVCSVDNFGLPGSYSNFRTFIVGLDKNKPFLRVDSPPGNSVVTDNKIEITGATEVRCPVTVDGNNIIPDESGNFRIPQILKEGKNIITVVSENAGGIKNIVSKIVYCESDPIPKVTEKSIGLMKDSVKIITGSDYNLLDLETRALSRIEIKSANSGWSAATYSDTLGACRLTIPFIQSNETFILTVLTPAKFKRTILIELAKKNMKPEIILDGMVPYATNKSEATISGQVVNAKELLVNGEKVPVDGANRFVSKQILNKLNNSFELIAADTNGNISIVERNIKYDNNPPKLISHKLTKQSDGGTFYRLIVKAEDETSLKQSAEAEVIFGNEVRTEVLQYDPINKIYETVFNSESFEYPVIRNITLEDYLANRKTYTIRN
ncbi:MAG: hypothetical protein CVV24_05275 [Ignavibacteriae bacterium HGW-Ignavibacteriae-3]|nr:MAG: hypothetical protein CVV24_05275 [Ignavibacteriae bacterium HGW-Ignavibacteriae-3]